MCPQKYFTDEKEKKKKESNRHIRLMKLFVIPSNLTRLSALVPELKTIF